MKVLALEPYYGGSHRGFLDGWRTRSRHDWTLLSLPPYKWKWRMRHSAVTFAAEIERRSVGGASWDCLFCSDMLNLAELKGLAPAVATLPSVLYFHENQITYPMRHEKERDFQFGMTNILSALAADRVWFNSRFHRDEFIDSIPPFLNRMPDYRPLEAVRAVRSKAAVCRPGVACSTGRPTERPPGPLRILWAARWEFDKNPECFFDAIAGLREAGVPFRISVLGESFRDVPRVFERARSEFRDEIEVWGFQRARADYQRALMRADVFVSTALHEFFGISAAEAMAAGAYPVLPRRLAYPELLGLPAGRSRSGDPMEAHFYDGSVGQLRRRLRDLAESLETLGTVWGSTRDGCSELVSALCWANRASRLDDALQGTVEGVLRSGADASGEARADAGTVGRAGAGESTERHSPAPATRRILPAEPAREAEGSRGETV